MFHVLDVLYNIHPTDLINIGDLSLFNMHKQYINSHMFPNSMWFYMSKHGKAVCTHIYMVKYCYLLNYNSTSHLHEDIRNFESIIQFTMDIFFTYTFRMHIYTSWYNKELSKANQNVYGSDNIHSIQKTLFPIVIPHV